MFEFEILLEADGDLSLTDVVDLVTLPTAIGGSADNARDQDHPSLSHFLRRL